MIYERYESTNLAKQSGYRNDPVRVAHQCYKSREVTVSAVQIKTHGDNICDNKRKRIFYQESKNQRIVNFQLKLN